ncbi:MAG: hypothetical protein Q8M15_07180 [Bacteroidota bacterium]|nr:hypothetical protein [Bacteroidota bacterium]
MKKLKLNLKLLTVLLILPALFVLNSCRKAERMPCQPDPNVTVTAPSTDMQIPDLPLIQTPELQESTMDLELSIKADGIPEDEDMQISLDEKNMEFGSKSKINDGFLKFLKSLNLSAEQKINLKRAIMAHNDCRKDLFAQLKKLNKELITLANKERAELIMKYKKHLITEAQLKRELAALNARIKHALKENPARIRIISALEKCHQEFISHIKSILNREQLELWIKWHNRTKTHK